MLVGYRATGKSTVGRLLSPLTGLAFVDVDPALEARYGLPVPAIFTQHGEPTFRDWEEATLADLTIGPPVVLATGGGAVLRASNRDRLREFGAVVWLSAPPDELAARLSTSSREVADRPALTSAGTLAEIGDVLAQRVPLYREAADVEVPTGGLSAEEVAQAVLDALPRFRR